MRSLLSTRWLRALLWALALALPLQAVAVVSGAACHHQSAGADVGNPPCHPGATKAATASDCSACAVCCLGAALPMSWPLLTPVRERHAAPELPLPASLSIVMPGLERPPRHTAV